MAISCALLMCHAPIVVPAVAGDRAVPCSGTTRAMSEAAARMRAHAPNVLVVISPHVRRDRQRWSVCTADAVSGSFARFGAAQTRLSLPGAPSQLDPLRYGVVVSYGTACGVLLPNIDGVSTYDEQIRIAADKGPLPHERRDHLADRALRSREKRRSAAACHDEARW